jgi:hypothetical protein
MHSYPDRFASSLVYTTRGSRPILTLSIPQSTMILHTAFSTLPNDMCVVATPTKRLDILEKGLEDLDIYSSI